MSLPSPSLLLQLHQVHKQRKRVKTRSIQEKTEVLAHPASCRQGRHENHSENSSLHSLSSASLRHSPVIKLFLYLLELIKKHLCKQKQDLSANCFISVESLLGMDPNWLLHNLVLTLAACMERSPEAEPLLLLQAQNSFQGLQEGTQKGLKHPTKIVQQ